MSRLEDKEKCIYCREYGNFPCEECDRKLAEKSKGMSRLEEIFNKTISEYNENTSDINKFKFSQREKDIFKGMIRRYATEVAEASLEKAYRNSALRLDLLESYEYVALNESITNPENIVLL